MLCGQMSAEINTMRTHVSQTNVVWTNVVWTNVVWTNVVGTNVVCTNVVWTNIDHKKLIPIIYLFIVDRLNDECIVVKDATDNIVCCHQSLFESNISFPENPVKGNPEDELNGESCIIISLILQWKPLNVITVNVISHLLGSK
jgi:hypothetical protein